MGQSKSIEQLAQKNEAFQKFIQDMRRDLDAELEKQKAVVKGLVEAYRKDFGDEVMVLEGTFAHQTTVSEWSLDAVNKMIDACRNAILGGPAPEGIAKGEDAKNIATAMGGIQSVNQIIGNAAFNVVQSLLRSVGSRTKLETQSSSRSVPIAPGLRLVIAVIENGYEETSFFNKESIAQTVFVFSARYSLKEGKLQAEMAGLTALSDLSAAFAVQLKQVSKEIATLDIMADNYDERMDRLEKIQGRIQTNMRALDKEIRALGGTPTDRVALHDTVDTVVQNVRQLRKAHRLLAEA